MDIGTFKDGQLEKIRSSIQDNNNLKDIVVYVHGAPLMRDVTVKKSESRLRMIKSNDAGIHPILFNWDGSLMDVYGDRLFRIRNGKEIGQEISKLRGFATAPAYVFADLVAAIGIAPGIWFEHIGRIAEVEYPGLDRSMSGEKAKSEQQHHLALAPLASKPENSENCGTNFQISETMRYEPGISVGTAVDGLRSVPILLMSSFLASGGRSVWKNYHRRTHVAVRAAREFNTENHNVHDDTPTGMFAVLMDGILTEIAETERDIRVVMIGHSTGTMILTEYLATLLQRSTAEENEAVKRSMAAENKAVKLKLPPGAEKITDIVFLGAASTVGDTSKAVFPFLQINPNANFSNISLNAYHEEKSTWGGVLLTGSLLEWLDNSIAQPASQLDRVIGRWENVMLTMHTIPCKIRDRVHLIHLPKKEGYPEKHGELDEVSDKFNPFRDSSWRVESATKSIKCSECSD